MNRLSFFLLILTLVASCTNHSDEFSNEQWSSDNYIFEVWNRYYPLMDGDSEDDLSFQTILLADNVVIFSENDIHVNSEEEITEKYDMNIAQSENVHYYYPHYDVHYSDSNRRLLYDAYSGELLLEARNGWVGYPEDESASIKVASIPLDKHSKEIIKQHLKLTGERVVVGDKKRGEALALYREFMSKGNHLSHGTYSYDDLTLIRESFSNPFNFNIHKDAFKNYPEPLKNKLIETGDIFQFNEFKGETASSLRRTISRTSLKNKSKKTREWTEMLNNNGGYLVYDTHFRTTIGFETKSYLVFAPSKDSPDGVNGVAVGMVVWKDASGTLYLENNKIFYANYVINTDNTISLTKCHVGSYSRRKNNQDYKIVDDIDMVVNYKNGSLRGNVWVNPKQLERNITIDLTSELDNRTVELFIMDIRGVREQLL